MALHSAKSDLPLAYFLLAPELRDRTLPDERTSDCERCPMEPQPEDTEPPSRVVFNPKTRCCTYNPWLGNFLVGRILRRNDRGSNQIRKRMGSGEGINRYGVRPPPSFYRRYWDNPSERFGMDMGIRCPYWVDDGLHCTIWRDRNPVCRSWFCKHEDGIRGQALWNAYRDLLEVIQTIIVRWLATLGTPPNPETAGVRDWSRYFVWCADRLDRATLSELRALDGPGLRKAREHYVTCDLERITHEIPEILGPNIAVMENVDDAHVMFCGYSAYHTSRPLRREIFVLFSKMNGVLTWREALHQTEEELGEALFTEDDIVALYRIGALEARKPEDLIPGAYVTGVPADMVMRLEDGRMELEWSYDTDAETGTPRLEVK